MPTKLRFCINEQNMKDHDKFVYFVSVCSADGRIEPDIVPRINAIMFVCAMSAVKVDRPHFNKDRQNHFWLQHPYAFVKIQMWGIEDRGKWVFFWRYISQITGKLCEKLWNKMCNGNPSRSTVYSFQPSQTCMAGIRTRDKTSSACAVT